MAKPVIHNLPYPSITEVAARLGVPNRRLATIITSVDSIQNGKRMIPKKSIIALRLAMGGNPGIASPGKKNKSRSKASRISRSRSIRKPR